MKTIRLLLLVVLVAFCPARAYALEGWWDWLDALSGPGPYHGLGFGFWIACAPEAEQGLQALCLREREPDQFKRMLDVRFSFDVWGGGQRFQDDPGDARSVNAFSFDTFYLFRINTTLDIDVGPGVGFVRYSGDGFEPIYRFTFSPLSFSMAPFAESEPRWVRGVRVRLDSMYVPQGFTATDFGNFASRFETNGEFLTRMAVVYRF